MAAQSPHWADAGRELSTEESSRPLPMSDGGTQWAGSCWRIRFDRREPGKKTFVGNPVLPMFRLTDRLREFANSIHYDSRPLLKALRAGKGLDAGIGLARVTQRIVFAWLAHADRKGTVRHLGGTGESWPITRRSWWGGAMRDGL